jgi:trk system potassium uptake protein TrkH
MQQRRASGESLMRAIDDRRRTIVPVLHVISLFVTALGLLMLVPAVVDAVSDHPDWQVFTISAATVSFFGLALGIATRGPLFRLSVHQGFLLTTGLWLAAALVGAVPLMYSEFNLDLADAFFESMSGLTTTGSTVITGLDAAPPGILLWRAMLQAIGGIGFIVVGLAILPMLRVGGMQLFRLESSEKSDKAVPQARHFALLLLGIYAALTFACAIALRASGMDWLEATTHAMSTLSTGGFSTSDASVGHFGSPAIEWIITLFMLAGSLPFILYLRFLQGRPQAIFADEQARGYLRFLVVVSVGLAIWLMATRPVGPLEALRLAAFNVVSVVTTTGFASTDYSTWGNFAVCVFFLLTFVGGCTGSTSGGLKAFRFDILYVALRGYLHRLIYPHSAIAPTYNGRAVGDDIFSGVLLFMGVYLISVAGVALVLSLLGLDLITSVSGAATAIGNVGPGLGPVIGPAGNFAPLPDAAKWVLAFAMLLGRLEFFTILALCTRSFWRQ